MLTVDGLRSLLTAAIGLKSIFAPSMIAKCCSRSTPTLLPQTDRQLPAARP
jgi:hypothetical protein